MSKRAPNLLKRGNQVKPDTATLCNKLVSVSDWRMLGLYLGVQDYELDQIERSRSAEGCDGWKRETFSLWLRHTPNASWGDVVEALQKMGENTVAKGIEQNYIMEPEHAEDNPLPVANSSSQELQSVLRREYSNTNTTNGTNTALLSRQPPFQQLSPSAQEEIRAILDEDVREMQCQFGCLVTKTRDSVEQRIPVQNFAGSILVLGAYEPVPEGRDQSLLDEHGEEIKSAKSISAIFNILSAYWNYLNYEILEYTIELYGTNADIARLESYNEELHNFCQRRLFELPLSESGTGSGNARQEKFDVKLNVREGVTCKELLRIRRRIAKILRVNLAALIIDRVDTGCVQLTFLIPKFVAQEIFPLSDDQTSALSKDVAVIRLECGDYVFEETELPLPEIEPPLLETEPPLPQTEPPLLDTEPSLLKTEPPLLETEPPLLETEPSLLDTEPPLPETEPPLLEMEPPLLQTESPLPQTEPPLLDTEPSPPETEPPLLETEPPLLETEPSQLDTLPESEIAALKKKALGTVPEVQGKMHAVATTSDFIDNKSVSMETEPSLPESEVAALKKKALGTVPEVQGKMHAVATTSDFIDNKSVSMETESSLPESEVAALKKKALGVVPQVPRKRKLKDDLDTDQPAPKRHIMGGPSQPRDSQADHQSTSRTSQHVFDSQHKRKTPPRESGGYDCEFIDPPPTVLETKCPICLNVLCKPKQTSCGHIFCETCIEPIETCPICKKTSFSTFYDKKLQRDLNQLQVRCTYQERGCTWTGELGKLDNHLNMSDPSSGCEYADICCKFSYAGCTTKVPRKDMTAHMEEEQPHHIELLAEKVEEQEREMHQLQSELQNSNELLLQSEQQARREIDNLQSELQNTTEQVKKQGSEVNQLQSELQNRDELLMRIQQQVRRVAPHLPSHDEKFHKIMKESRELTQLLDTPMSELVRKPLQTAKPSQRISTDFSFTMENFDLYKSNNAEWYSEPFYTHPRGYKMCVRIDANGYEQVNGTHVSLYTCMMKGEYDDELLWPFRGEIAVELLSQDATHTEGNHYTIRYDDNVREKYAKRVTVGEISPGWGKTQFIPHFKLEPYLKNDCLKIRIHIELFR